MTVTTAMPVEFTEPLADSRDYPAAQFSMLARDHRCVAAGSARPAMENVGTVLPMAWARNALALIGSFALPKGATVLLPAYHCPALVEPFIWAGATIRFYPLNEQLDPD